MFLLISGKAWGPAGRVGQARRETGNLLAGWRGPDKDADNDTDAMLENAGPQRSALLASALWALLFLHLLNGANSCYYLAV